MYYSTSSEEILLGPSFEPAREDHCRFGLGIGCVHHMSNELGEIGKSRFRMNAGGVCCGDER
jgi:hypothetical protein